MAITSTQSTGNGVFNLVVGRYIDTGTVAAFTITTGFQPRYVKVVNLNASGDVTVEWFEGMADASAILRGIDGAQSLITTLGITPLSYGFTVGLQTDLVVSSEQLSWLALG